MFANFFEKIGRRALSPKNSSLFLCTLFLLPLFLAGSYGFYKLHHYKEEKKQLDHLIRKATLSLSYRQGKKAFLQKYGNADPLYLSHTLEPIELNREKRKLLQKIHQHPAYQKQPSLQKQFHFLQNKNQIQFTSNELFSSPQLKESEEKLVHPIEVSYEDFSKILHYIEGFPVAEDFSFQKPQLFLKTFSLIPKEKGFLIDITLIKREFFPKESK